MPIIDEDNLLTDQEIKKLNMILEEHKFRPDNFMIEVTEDQDNMDMDDLNYIIILYVSVTHMGSKISNTYRSRAKSGNWLAEFENDLKKGAFNK